MNHNRMRICIGIQRSGFADLHRHVSAYAGEIFLERRTELSRRRFLHHPYQHAQLDPIGMRLDFTRFRRKGIRAALQMQGLFGIRDGVENFAMGIGNRGLADVIVHRVPPFFVGSDQLDFDLCSMRRFPIHDLVDDNLRRIFARVDLNLIIMGGFFTSGARRDGDGLAGGQQSIHAGSRDADSLLAAGLLEGVKL